MTAGGTVADHVFGCIRVVHPSKKKKAGLNHKLRHLPTSLFFAKVGGNLQRSYVYLIYKSGDIEGLVPVPKLSEIIHDWRIRPKWSPISFPVTIFSFNDPR